MSTAATTRLTAERFERQYADCDFCELERGEVVHLTAGGWLHSAICSKVTILLGNWARQQGTGRVLSSEAGLITARDPDTVRGVDVLYFAFERVPRGREPESFAEIPPNLAVEVIGKGQGWNKMTEKVAEYLRMGVDRAWILDPRNRTLHVFQQNEPPREYREGDTVGGDPALPGFSCKVGEFFED